MMNKKIFTNLAILIFLVLALNFASAQVFTVTGVPSSTQNIDETKGNYKFTFQVEYTGTSTTDVDFSSSTSTLGTALSFSPASLTGLTNTTGKVTVTGTVSNFATLGGSTVTVTVVANPSVSGASSETRTFSLVINDIFQLCELKNNVGNVGDLRISDFDMSNFGEGDDNEWFPLDRIEIEVEIENTHNSDRISDVQVDLFIYDEDGNDVTNDFDVKDDSIDLGGIRDGEEEVATFVIEEVPADADTGNYRIYVVAYSDGDEDLQCVSSSNRLSDEFYEAFEYTRDEDEAVVVRSQDLETKVVAQCGQNDVVVSFPVYNIGEDKEDGVLVNIYNKDLGIDEYKFIENLRSGKKSQVDFLLNIPQSARQGIHRLEIFTFFQYDEDEDRFDTASYDRNSFEDLDKDYILTLEVLGCAASNGPTVSARLDSDAILGEELIITATITNPNNMEEFLVSLGGYSSWAELVSVTPQRFSLGQLQSQEVTIRLIPTSEGFHTLSIDTTVGGQTFSQPVSVNIAGQGGSSGSGGILGLGSLDNKTLSYAVIALVVLIVIILALIVSRVSKSA